jgi:hypothetical protein
VGDPFTQELIAKLVLDPAAVPNFSWMDGVLCYKSRIWVGADSSMHQKLISALHDSALGGHSGISVTYRRLKQMFAWKNTKIEVQDFVKACIFCQHAKPNRQNSGIIPVFIRPWDVLHLKLCMGILQNTLPFLM